VLAGGGARLPYMTEIAESVLRRPSRLASALPLAKMPVELAEPECATTVGLVLYAYRVRMAHGRNGDGSITQKLRALFARRGA
jgi:cell division protein FtsA